MCILVNSILFYWKLIRILVSLWSTQMCLDFIPHGTNYSEIQACSVLNKFYFKSYKFICIQQGITTDYERNGNMNFPLSTYWDFSFYCMGSFFFFLIRWENNNNNALLHSVGSANWFDSSIFIPIDVPTDYGPWHKASIGDASSVLSRSRFPENWKY